MASASLSDTKYIGSMEAPNPKIEFLYKNSCNSDDSYRNFIKLCISIHNICENMSEKKGEDNAKGKKVIRPRTQSRFFLTTRYPVRFARR